MKNNLPNIDDTYTILIDSPIGKIGVRYAKDFIYNVYFENEIDFVENYKHNSLSKAIKMQFKEYFSRNKTIIDLPYKLNTPPFSFNCLTELKKVRYGSITTYKEIAIAVGNPKAARAVGNVMNKNPIPIIIPCHRVVGVSGKLVGFSGGLERKQWLLNFEKNIINNNNVMPQQ